MKLRELLAARGIHYLVRRFGWQKLRMQAYDEKYRNGTWTYAGLDGVSELAGIVTRYLRQGDLLIMGCGGAALIEGLAAGTFASVLGVDLSQEGIRLASQYASDRVSFQVADMVTFACPRPFDVILFSESLYYLPIPAQEPLLRRLSHHLKLAGVFIVTIAHADRYAHVLDCIRKKFAVVEDRQFSGAARRVIVFREHLPVKLPPPR